MFDIYCPRHQSRVLLGPRAVEALENTDDGVVIHWRCRCGETGTEVHGPRSATHDTPASAARTAA
jgi:hypothetical protein